jgi:hypothetical protein
MTMISINALKVTFAVFYPAQIGALNQNFRTLSKINQFFVLEFNFVYVQI